MKTVLFVVSGLLLMSCAGQQTYERIMTEKTLKRAAFDFGCTEENLEITVLNSNTYGVEGCEKKATYVVIGSSCLPGTSRTAAQKLCNVVLNTDAEDADQGTEDDQTPSPENN